MKTHIERKERVVYHALYRPQGISEREMMVELNLTSSRNEVNRVEHLTGIKFKREWVKTKDGLGRYYRYSIPNAETAYKLIKFVNEKRLMRGGEMLSADETQQILSQYEGGV